MGIGNFYKQPKPQKFRYVYRYYDPKKEEMDRKIRRAERKLDPSIPPHPQDIKENLRGSIKSQSETLAKYGKEERASDMLNKKNWRLMLFLILALVLLIWLFNHVGLSFFKYTFSWLR